MRNLLEPAIDRWRLRDARTIALYGSAGDETCGRFLVRGGGVALLVVASSDVGWDHLSVSAREGNRVRTPSWDEMERVKRLFFEPQECCVQFHVPVDDYLNFHPHCLHIWRWQDGDFPRPPGWMVAPTPGMGAEVERAYAERRGAGAGEG